MAQFLTLTYRQFDQRFYELLAFTMALGELRIYVPDCRRTVILKGRNDLMSPHITFTIVESS